MPDPERVGNWLSVNVIDTSIIQEKRAKLEYPDLGEKIALFGQECALKYRTPPKANG